MGAVVSSDGVIDLDVRPPAAMGGAGGRGTNPEQLFAAGYAVCFENALILAARRQKKNVEDARVTARVSIGPVAGGAFGLEVDLRVALPGLDKAEAEALVALGH